MSDSPCASRTAKPARRTSPKSSPGSTNSTLSPRPCAACAATGEAHENHKPAQRNSRKPRNSHSSHGSHNSHSWEMPGKIQASLKYRGPEGLYRLPGREVYGFGFASVHAWRSVRLFSPRRGRNRNFRVCRPETPRRSRGPGIRGR